MPPDHCVTHLLKPVEECPESHLRLLEIVAVSNICLNTTHLKEAVSYLNIEIDTPSINSTLHKIWSELKLLIPDISSRFH
ncbi:MAG: hypothetical protein Q9M13_09900, partial [Mariprofundales bacterium]|nr:hypothetical protein [Mariprofundales bacterium]